MCVALVSVCAFAQKGEKAVGVNLSYGTEISNIGIGVKGQYNFTDAIRGEVSFDYFLEKDYLKMWDINVNAHYLFNVAEKIKVYPLAGLAYTNWSAVETLSRFGANLGGGAQYDINEKLSLNLDIKYQFISDFNQAVFGVGAAYKF